ncbi:carboxymuconolactone decarboxylase family protein [Rhodococcus sp. ACT016]|uniref:carboxymuconolactone decarboxylase family protein n=1 Tax=Rhodococcus sp. ACT016 TaxID=3134808 RepID=UPI003D2BDAD6
MRLALFDRNQRLRTKALFALIRLVSRQPVLDAVRLAMYRPEFYGGGQLTHAAMRGPSTWSVGDRELMAAFVSKVNQSPFCVAAHSATSRLWFDDNAKVAATLSDVTTAPIDEKLRATLTLLGKLTLEHCVTPEDIQAVLARGVSADQIEDALAVCLAFNIMDRLADAFDFSVANPAAIDSGARYLLKRGYR